MKKLILGGVALGFLVLTGPATAADLNVKTLVSKARPAPSVWVATWTGLYVGAHGGCGWYDTPVPSNYAWENPIFGPLLDTEGPGIFTTASPSGCFGGGQIGYNYQLANNVVVGIEADVSFANFGSSFTWNQDNGDDINNWESKLTTFGTLRGRLGYALGQWLPYVTGGWAWGRHQLTTTCPTSCSSFGDPATSSDTKTHNGWVIGAGLEYAINQNWSVKAEYLHLDLGSERYNIQVDFDDLVPSGLDSGNLKIDVVKFGLNYRFVWGGPVVAKY